MRISMFVCLFALSACPSLPDPITPPVDGGVGGAPPVVVPDAGADTLAACTHLAELACPEGMREDCATLMSVMLTQDPEAFDLECIMQSTSAEQVRECGSVQC